MAGQSCEHFHIDAEAVSCLALLQENFSQIPQSQQATAILRRLELKGRPAKIGGPTRKGGFITLDQLRGKPILVVFWSSDSDSFEEILPKLKATLQPYENGDLAVLGVCLDEAEETLDQFVQKNGLSWTQIFYADPAKRHWEHPLVQYYGVRDIPSLWLVNADGIVVDTRVTPETLEGQLRYLVAAGGHTARQ